MKKELRMNNFIEKLKQIKKFIYIYTYEILSHKGSILCDLFIGLSLPITIQIISWNYIYSSENHIHNYTYLKMILYIIATVTMFKLNNGYDLINDTSKRIQNGSIDIFNIKTMSYFSFSLFTMIGREIFFIIFGIIVLVSCCILNNNYIYIIPTIVFLFLSQFICFQISYIFALINYWVVQNDLLQFMYFLLAQILGGILLPIEFWPETFQILLKYNPFRVTISGIPDLILNPSNLSLLKYTCLLIFYGILFQLIILFLTKKSTKINPSYGG
jgi:ABC-2 type transport system permease protein